jgi:SAM-dependent methyltransferase
MTESGIDAVFYPETVAGGFTRIDGSIAFYTRINALLEPSMVALDLGAGRGAFLDGASRYRRNLLKLQGKVSKLIGIDVDRAVLGHPALDEAIVYDGGRIPLDDRSVDMVVSDWVFEHVGDPAVFASEIDRILKPGGWVCARTPHLFSALVAVSSIIPSRTHSRALSAIQPGRQDRDVFPTRYRLNSIGAVKRWFPTPRWENYSYTWSPEPAYHFGHKVVYRLMQIYQYLKAPLLGGECLFVFLRKEGGGDDAP